MYLFMAFEARPAFKWSLAAWCKAPSSIGPSRSLGVLAISDISVQVVLCQINIFVSPINPKYNDRFFSDLLRFKQNVLKFKTQSL